ncbi:hypothetical protein D3C71_1738880 [compost metagenome]
MQTPDLRVLGHLVPMQGQAVDNGIEHRFGHQWPMKRALRLDRGGLFTGHAGGEQQRPHAVVTGQRADAAFDTGHQAQALACEAEVAHGRVPSKEPCSARNPQAVSILNAVPSLSSSIEEPLRKMENWR